MASVRPDTLVEPRIDHQDVHTHGRFGAASPLSRQRRKAIPAWGNPQEQGTAPPKG